MCEKYTICYMYSQLLPEGHALAAPEQIKKHTDDRGATRSRPTQKVHGVEARLGRGGEADRGGVGMEGPTAPCHRQRAPPAGPANAPTGARPSVSTERASGPTAGTQQPLETTPTPTTDADTNAGGARRQRRTTAPAAAAARDASANFSVAFTQFCEVLFFLFFRGRANFGVQQPCPSTPNWPPLR